VEESTPPDMATAMVWKFGIWQINESAPDAVWRKANSE